MTKDGHGLMVRTTCQRYKRAGRAPSHGASAPAAVIDSQAPGEEACMRSCSDVHNLLLEEGIPHEIVHLPSLSTTAQRAAELLGVDTAEVVKSLVFYMDDEPTLVLVPGNSVADEDRLRSTLGCRHVRLAKAQEVLAVTGYRRGAVPPCGLATSLPVVADPSAFVPPVVYCGGGTTTTMLKLRSEDLRRLVAPRLETIAAASSEGSTTTWVAVPKSVRQRTPKP